MSMQSMNKLKENRSCSAIFLPVVFAGVLMLFGCGEGSKSDETEKEPEVVEIAEPILEMKPGKVAHWKRVRAIENDLAYALDTPVDQLCQELGTLSCFDQVHLSLLGGNEPFVLTQYEPVESPTAISVVAAERVVLSACSNKVDSDQSAQATIFTEYDLSEMSKPTDSAYLAALNAQNTSLYQRLLVRDPTKEELTLLQSLAVNDEGEAVSNSDVAKLSCFAIATSSEFIFL